MAYIVFLIVSFAGHPYWGEGLGFKGFRYVWVEGVLDLVCIGPVGFRVQVMKLFRAEGQKEKHKIRPGTIP